MNEQQTSTEAGFLDLTDLQSALRVSRDEVARWVTAAIRAEGLSASEISVVLVDDPTIREINARHLGHDWATDVVTFPLDDSAGGEVVVSTDTAIAEAERRGVSPHSELALYVIHGVLHLCGHDDRDDASRHLMFRRQGEILGRLGFDAVALSMPVGAGSAPPQVPA